jgi:hypothetical protein
MRRIALPISRAKAIVMMTTTALVAAPASAQAQTSWVGTTSPDGFTGSN